MPEHENHHKHGKKEHHGSGICPVFVVLFILQVMYLWTLKELKNCHQQIRMFKKAKDVVAKKLAAADNEKSVDFPTLIQTTEDSTENGSNGSTLQKIETRGPHYLNQVSECPPSVEVLDDDSDIQDKSGADQVPSIVNESSFSYQFAEPPSSDRPLIQKGTISGSINTSVQME